jgi:septal ring factor EnvC (AmiA/AmiB activator)
MKSSPSFIAIAGFCTFSLLFSPGLYSQDFSSIDKDLSELESLISATLENSEEQQKQLDTLRKNLAESGELIRNYETIITERETLLKDLQTRLNAMSETYKTQSALSAKYEKSSKFWRTFTLIAVPVTAIVSGGLALAIR